MAGRMIFIIFLALVSAGFTVNNNSTVTTLVTRAFDRGTRVLLYTEERKQTDQPDRPGIWNFTYKNAQGETIVKRHVNFERDPIKPDFRLDDLRTGYAEGAEVTGSMIRVFTGGSPDDPYQEKILSVPEPAIIDAGFNFLVEKNWVKLMKGELLTFNFVAPSQLDYFSFRVYKKRDIVHQNRPAVMLHMDIDNFFLRLFVEAIHLTYDTESRKLVVYDGISNIYNDDGKSHKVRMEFNYQAVE
ncbi:hypothetical protein JNL27_06155 [bacterium]|nr:hypothetical protein [bacterium]